MRTKWKVLIGILVLCSCMALYIMPKMVQSSIPSIYYVTPNQKTYENIINCTGTVQANHMQSIYLDVPAVVSQVHVSIGDRVETGQLLVTLDTERPQHWESQASDFEMPESASVDWVGLAGSYGLSATVTSQAPFYETELEHLFREIAGLPNVRQTAAMQASVVQEEILAPFDGVVIDLSICDGMPFGSGQPALTIMDDTAYYISAQVGEADIAKVRIGDTALVQGVGFGGNSYTGEVVFIHPTARKVFSTGSADTVVDVEIALWDSDRNLKPGFTAKVEIIGGEDYNLLTVPYETIRQDENNEEYVYVYEDGKIKKSLITTGKEMTNEVQVLSGLTQENIVVYNPGDITREGAMIHLKGRADAT